MTTVPAGPVPGTGPPRARHRVNAQSPAGSRAGGWPAPGQTRQRPGPNLQKPNLDGFLHSIPRAQRTHHHGGGGALMDPNPPACVCDARPLSAQTPPPSHLWCAKKTGTKWRLGTDNNLISNAFIRGFKQLHGMALEFVYRAQNRRKSNGAPAGAFPKPPRGRVGRGSGPKSRISGPTPRTKPKQVFDCIGVMVQGCPVVFAAGLGERILRSAVILFAYGRFEAGGRAHANPGPTWWRLNGGWSKPCENTGSKMAGMRISIGPCRRAALSTGNPPHAFSF